MEEINFIRPQEVYDRNTGESKVRYTSYDGSNKFIPVVDGEDGVPRTLVVTTHAELKAMRDAGKLTPGALYRITDYQCTTTQENTRSAGHQFDIVLLALSENKLAEEGWAMMHDNIYDVTFSNGVTKKCYIYFYNKGDSYNIVDCDTLLGATTEISLSSYDLTINEMQKTATLDANYSDVAEENLPYNYFQNSNLSAWKVWYCLDNDTSRFAWADDSVTIKTLQDNDVLLEKRRGSNDVEFNGNTYYQWYAEGSSNSYTLEEKPTINSKIYAVSGPPNAFIMKESTEKIVDVKIGRGVIYRLVDEWNNDVPYDFKNIQFVRPMTDGAYDPDGEDTWVYTFTNTYDGSIKDASLLYYKENLGFSVVYAEANYINSSIDSVYTLPYNVFISDDVMSYNKLDCFAINNTCVGINNTVMYGTSDKDNVEASSIYIGDKKVLTES